MHSTDRPNTGVEVRSLHPHEMHLINYTVTKEVDPLLTNWFKYFFLVLELVKSGSRIAALFYGITKLLELTTFLQPHFLVG